MMVAPGTGQDSETNRLEQLVRALEQIRNDLVVAEERFRDAVDHTDPSNRLSALNLAHYVALRHRDIRALQEELAEFGLSSLGRAEAHVQATVEAALAAARSLAGRQSPGQPPALDFISGGKLLRRKTNALLGPEPAGRVVRIMVTMPSEAATDYALVKALVASGMNLMRVNCAHDGPDAWRAMISNLERARRELNQQCRVEIDLAGPKLRTGPLEPGPEVFKIKPLRDAEGRVLEPGRTTLVPAAAFDRAALPALPLEQGNLELLKAGDVLEFRDARNSDRRLIVRGVKNGSATAETSKTAYVASGTELRCKGADRRFTVRVGALPAVEVPIMLKPGDRARLSASASVGCSARLDDHGKPQRPAIITCTTPEVLRDVAVGEEVWFDDGRIGALVRATEDGELDLEVTHAAASGSNLRANKGINLPQTKLKMPPLTDKDIRDLDFIARYADIVGYSFVRTQTDVEMLLAELTHRKRVNIGIVLKIETRQAFENLPALLFTIMRHSSAGVMIARGDLAVECGYERLAEVQEEVLWMCEAAHLPVVWATQVLETMAKMGLPSRAEITDAAMGVRAECVMLNKGPFVVEAVASLNDILHRMQTHQMKKRSLLRRLRW